MAWFGALSTLQLLALAGGMLVLGLLAGQWWFLIHLLARMAPPLRLEALESTVGLGGAAPVPERCPCPTGG